MSRGTTVKIIRVYTSQTMPAAEFDALAAKESEMWGTLPEQSKFTPPKIVCIDSADGKQQVVLSETREKADTLLSWTFGSQFTSLLEACGLDYADPAKSVAVLSQQDVFAIRMALKYLLGRKYSPEMDSVMEASGTDWLRLLAQPDRSEPFLPYVLRNHPQQLQSAMETDDGIAELQLRRLQAAVEAYCTALDDEILRSGSKLVFAVEVWG